MSKEFNLDVQGALDILDTYQSPKLKEVSRVLKEAVSVIPVENEERGFDPLQKAHQMIEILNHSIKTYETAAENLEKTHKATQDLLHALELLDLSEDEMIQMARDLHEVRRIRRESKDFTEIMLPMYDLACKYQHLTQEFSSAMAEMQEIASRKEKRRYIVRERTDLAEKFEKLA
jgi:prophage DNA circulation protein